MICLGVIHLEDYEKWIKSLGYDREWLIQATQAEVYRHVVVESAALEMFSIPLTYDVYLVIANSIAVNIKSLVKTLETKVPLRFSTYLGLGETYLTALSSLRPLNVLEGVNIDVGGEPTVAVHIDMNSYNNLVREKGVHYISELITEITYAMKKSCAVFGGIAYYAGGDNIICFLPYSNLEAFLKSASFDNAKIGIGIAESPRAALKLAAQALDLIRSGKCSGSVCVLREE